MNEYTPKIWPILTWPNDERLHMKSKDVGEFDNKLQIVVKDMLNTMRANNGVGLAAPQIGIMVNLIVIELPGDLPLVLVNPTLVGASEELFQFSEGCLSVPGYFENRKRPKRIVVKYQDTKGEPREHEFTDLYAFAIQHEMDHLNGKLFVDDSSEMKKARILAKMKKVAKRKL